MPETSINTQKNALEIDGERRVADGGCQCVAGTSVKCKHVAAVLWHVNEETASSSSGTSSVSTCRCSQKPWNTGERKKFYLCLSWVVQKQVIFRSSKLHKMAEIGQ